MPLGALLSPVSSRQFLEIEKAHQASGRSRMPQCPGLRCVQEAQRPIGYELALSLYPVTGRASTLKLCILVAPAARTLWNKERHCIFLAYYLKAASLLFAPPNKVCT